MGSEKKRKRRASEVEVDSAAAAEKAERKRQKKLLREQKASEEASPIDSDNVNSVPALLSPIASPMAGKKLTKKLYKLIGHAAKAKCLRRGVKEVGLAFRKGEKGIVILAGDVFPVDVIAHIPYNCEEANIPYCYVPRKTELGMAGLTKRPTSVVLVTTKNMGQELKDELKPLAEEVRELLVIV